MDDFNSNEDKFDVYDEAGEAVDESAVLPLMSFSVDDDFGHDGPFKWTLYSPSGIEYTRKGNAIVFSPLDYGIWEVSLSFQNDDGEWELHASHSFDNPDPDAVPEAVFLKNKGGVN